MYLIDTYQSLNGASAIAANGFLRYGLAFAFPLFTLQSKSTNRTSWLVATNKDMKLIYALVYQRLGTAWATSLLGFITIALMPIPWVLFKYGHKIRAKSSYDTIKV